MNEALRAVAALAVQQHGVVTRRQALAQGVSRWSFQRHVVNGLLVPVGTHTYQFAGTALTWHGRLQAGLLDLGPDALVARRSAAALHGLDGFPARSSSSCRGPTAIGERSARSIPGRRCPRSTARRSAVSP